MARSSARGPGSRVISPGGIQRVGPIQFFQETIAELRKSVWPTREETVRLTVYVLILSSVMTVFLAFMVDKSLSETFGRFILR